MFKAGVYTEANFCIILSRLGSMSNLLPMNSILRTPIDGQKSLAQFAVPAECPSVLAFLDNQTIVGECSTCGLTLAEQVWRGCCIVSQASLVASV